MPGWRAARRVRAVLMRGRELSETTRKTLQRIERSEIETEFIDVTAQP
jgi:hypothetical protein|tara:strand:+ start:6468 stop:6611 length:144 start_codon:yes stop_codon:yes gene_type:complete